VHLNGNRRDVRLSHPLYREAVLALLPEATRRRLLIEHIERLEALGKRRREDFLRLTIWRLDAGLPASRDALVSGTRAARAGNDFALTIRLAEAALASGADDEVVPALGDALYELGRFDESANVVSGALARATDQLAIATLAANLHRAELWGLDDADRALATLRSAHDRLTVPVLQDVLRAAEANVLSFSNRPREAIEVLDSIGRL